MSNSKVIAVAMSGGVDSSVAAARLVGSEAEVFGLMLRLWSAGEQYPNRCCSPRDVANARQVAARLGIRFYVLDAQQPFRDTVVEHFIDGYRQAITPNPCFTCNRQIRWGLLLERALALGATHLATGHYARNLRSNGTHQLFRARDRSKDQSYVLSVLGQAELAQSVFPLGELNKEQVRQQARELQLETADRSESQDLCFLGGRDYREFLTNQAGFQAQPGQIVDSSGEELGSHSGLHHYTIGQRKGIGVAGPEPLYVIEKLAGSNQLRVGPRAELARGSFRVTDLHWVSGEPPAADWELTVQIRYQAQPARCRLELNDNSDSAQVEVNEPLTAVTPGQVAVFYRGDECLGGGVIAA